MGENMKIVGNVSSPAEAKEMESIVELFVVNNQIKKIALQFKEQNLQLNEEELKLNKEKLQITKEDIVHDRKTMLKSIFGLIK
jgi:hypothetical protein